MFKIQVAKIFVHGFFSFLEESDARLFRSLVDALRHAKHIDQRRGGNGDTSKHDHSSVSLRACSRKRSRSGELDEGPVAIEAAPARLCQLSTTSTTPPTPNASTK